MRNVSIAMALLMLAGCDQSPAPSKPATPQQSSAISKEVRDFLQRRMECQHWAGEEGYDAARRAEINAAYARLRCAVLEADETDLKKRYDGNVVVQQALKRAPD